MGSNRKRKDEKKRLFVGIDPGLRGGICALLEDGTPEFVLPLPVYEDSIDVLELAEVLADYKGQYDIVAMIEDIIPMPRQGVKSTVKNGFIHGALRATLDLCGHGFYNVSPKEWQSVMLAGLRNGTSKEKSIVVASALVGADKIATPTGRPHDGLADAVCIAEYCRRTLLGNEKEEDY